MTRFDDNNTQCVGSNYFDERDAAKTDELLAAGYWVCFCADCIGHTRAAQYEHDADRYVRDKYPDIEIHDNGYRTLYYHLPRKKRR